MKYILIVLLVFPAGYLFSYARYTWRENKLSSTGSIVLAIVSVMFPAAVFLFR